MDPGNPRCCPPESDLKKGFPYKARHFHLRVLSLSKACCSGVSLRQSPMMDSVSIFWVVPPSSVMFLVT